MQIPREFVEKNRREIEIEANRIHELRKVFAPDFDDDYDNWITSINHIYKKHMNYEHINP